MNLSKVELMGRRREERGTTAEERSSLFEKYVSPNLGLVYQTVSDYTSNHSNIDDNYQEVQIQLLNYIDTYNPEKNLATWLITVAIRYVGKLEADRNHIIESEDTDNPSYVTKYSRKSRIIYRLIEDEEQFKDEANIISELSVSDEVYTALKEIDPKYIRPFLLRHEVDLPLIDIARMEGIKKDTAKMRIHMGKKLLQKKLERNE